MAKDVRLVAAQTLATLLQQDKTLAQLLPKASDQVAERDRPLLQELCFGSCRWYPRLKQLYLLLVDKPLKGKDTDIEALIYLGCYQLLYTRIAAHAAINETVNCAKKLNKPWAVKLLNAVFRRIQRDQTELLQQIDELDQGRLAHPKWLLKAVAKHWPDQAQAVYAANNAHPPMTLRVNLGRISRGDYQQRLAQQGIAAQATAFAASGLTLACAQDARQLPGFADGLVSVQDEAAQLAVQLLDLAPGQRVLDACAAPGGKTCHMLEQQPDLAELTALDISAKRLQKVTENLARLQPRGRARVTTLAADALASEDWFKGPGFDRILLDAPCSATGVIRRHPDIKVLRLANQVDALARLQLQLLTTLWATLNPGGRMLYATCSIMPAENTELVQRFLAQTPDARRFTPAVDWGVGQPAGRQLLPQAGGHDGFYYCVIDKLG